MAAAVATCPSQGLDRVGLAQGSLAQGGLHRVALQGIRAPDIQGPRPPPRRREPPRPQLLSGCSSPFHNLTDMLSPFRSPTPYPPPHALAARDARAARAGR